MVSFVIDLLSFPILEIGLNDHMFTNYDYYISIKII